MAGTNKFIKFAILEDNATGYDTFSDTELLSLVADEENSGIGFGTVARTNILNGLFRQLTKTNKIVGDLIVNNYGADVTVETAVADNVLEGYLKQSIENISKGVAVTKDTVTFNGTISGITVNSQGLVTNLVSLVAADIPELAQSKITSLTTDLAAKVPTSRTLAGLDLTENRSRDALLGITTGTGYVKRTDSDTYSVAALTATDIPELPQSKITSLTTDLNGKVSTSRTIAGSALSSDISRDTLIGVSSNGFVKRTGTDTYTVDNETYTPTSRTIAGTALSSNISRDTLIGVSSAGFVRRTSTANTYEIDPNTYATTSEVAYAEIDSPIVPTFWVGSQLEYDALGIKDSSVVYIII